MTRTIAPAAASRSAPTSSSCRTVRASTSRPAGTSSDGSDPNIYGWGPYDAVVSGAESRGLTVMFQLGGTAPDWATPGKSPVVTTITPERSTVRQYLATSLKRDRT